MNVFWKIRYLDRGTKLFGDRHLRLETDTLDPLTKAEVELVLEKRSSQGPEGGVINYRHLFSEPPTPSFVGVDLASIVSVCIPEYIEDEAGKQISLLDVAPIQTGDPNLRYVPNGMKPHYVDFALAEPKKPIPIIKDSLTDDELRLVGYFCRDVRELLASPIMKDGPGSLSSAYFRPETGPKFESAITDDEIRSSVTIFRRLYMTGRHDPASFLKIIPIFMKAIGDNPLSAWVQAIANDYQKSLDSVVDSRPFWRKTACPFKVKRLIDVFLYTQYAHQPDKDREKQFKKCLADVDGWRDYLTWSFLSEVWKLSIEIGNAGGQITSWYNAYCHFHGVSPDILASLKDHHSGLGVVEKEADRDNRLFEKKVEKLATALWNQDGRPECGPTKYLDAARKSLADRLGRRS